MTSERKARVILVKSRSDAHSLLTVRDDLGEHHTVFLDEPWRLAKGDIVTIELDEDGDAHIVDGLR